MALRVALPRPVEVEEEEVKPVEAVRARRLTVTTYLQLDPAIRFVIALALVAAISLFYLVQTSNVTELNYQVQNLQIEHTQLVRDSQQLQLAIARAQSLSHIQDVAVNKLHMVPVGDQYVYVGVPPAGTDSSAPPPTGGAPPVQSTVPDGGGGTP
jgi:hypothetical protein